MHACCDVITWHGESFTGNTTNSTDVTIVTPTNTSDVPSTMYNGTGSSDSNNNTLSPQTISRKAKIYSENVLQKYHILARENMKDKSWWKIAIGIILPFAFLSVLAMVFFLLLSKDCIVIR